MVGQEQILDPKSQIPKSRIPDSKFQMVVGGLDHPIALQWLGLPSKA